MLHKISLLDEISRGGYEASFVTTFNSFLPFYEEVVLRRLVTAGIRHNVLMMDAGQYAASQNSHPPRLAGRRYTLVPVKVPGAFHPKLIFLVGKRKGLVIVGSHNMTIAGFGFNRELTNVVRIEGDDDLAGISVAQGVWKEVEYWIERLNPSVPQAVKNMVTKVRDFAPWIDKESKPDSSVRILSSRPGERSLWQQFIHPIEGAAAGKVIITGAFFDERLTFLKKVEQDLRPGKCLVGLDPLTASIHESAQLLKGIRFVNADRFGVSQSKEEKKRGYLHAKAIYLEQVGGEPHFVSGSANPSSPAWLANATSGNVEMMLALSGDKAGEAVKKIAFLSLEEMPDLVESEWVTAKENNSADIESTPLGYDVGVAVVEDEFVLVGKDLVTSIQKSKFVLQDENSQQIAATNQAVIVGESVKIKYELDELSRAAELYCYLEGELNLKLLLHHSRQVEAQARSGTQKRFREALLSLDTNTPNLGLLIDCLERIVFAGDKKPSILRKNTNHSPASGDVKGKDLGSLAVDISETKKGRSRVKLNYQGDMGYLLDTLIHHLRLEVEKSLEGGDRRGRNEEEQVGADDSEDELDSAQLSVNEQKELLKACHSKVHTIVRRMVKQFRALSDGTQTLEDVLVRLLAVLAVLRELRGCDGRVSWVEQGETTVPQESRIMLFKECMLNLFEGDSSLLHLESTGEDFQHSVDVAKLKGLILWLAWDCGMEINLHKPFAESKEVLYERLQRNAMMLALAQSISQDELVIDEARQSVGSLTLSEMDWLEEIKSVSIQCDSLKHKHITPDQVGGGEPGDIAVHKTKSNWDARVVESSGGGKIYLMKLTKDQKPGVFVSGHWIVSRFPRSVSRRG